MTELIALMLSTLKSLCASFQAEMLSEGVETLLSRAAKLLAFMLSAGLDLITQSLAFVNFYLLDFFRLHKLLLDMLWVIYLIAFELSLIFSADACLLHKLIAFHAIAIMTLQSALMLSTGQESVALTLASWNRIKA